MPAVVRKLKSRVLHSTAVTPRSLREPSQFAVANERSNLALVEFNMAGEAFAPMLRQIGQLP